MSDTLESRITELEIRLSHQDDTVQSLNQIVIEQQARIETLQHQVEQLRLRLVEALEHQGPGIDPSQEPPPPHY